MFKLLPLGRSEGEPVCVNVPSIHHRAEGKGKEQEKKNEKRVKRNQRASTKAGAGG